MDWKEWHTLHWLTDIAPPLLMAMVGGIADCFLSDRHSISDVFINIFLAGFTGWMILLFCNETNVTLGWTGIYCGIGGFSSRVVLVFFRKVFLGKIKDFFKMNDDDTEAGEK